MAKNKSTKSIKSVSKLSKGKSFNWGTLAMIVVPILLAGLIATGILVTKKNNPTVVTDSGPAPSDVVQTLTNTPESLFANAAFTGFTGVQPTPDRDQLIKDGKPEILYVGSEWCPFCAAERWPLAIALSRFGTLSGLDLTRSDANDQAGPSTPSISFENSTYKSDYITATLIERENSKHEVINQLTPDQEELFKSIGRSSYPYVDIAGHYNVSAQYNPTILGGKDSTQSDVAAAINDPTSEISKSIIGSANVLTGMICKETSNQPSNVCETPEIQEVLKNIDEANSSSQAQNSEDSSPSTN